MDFTCSVTAIIATTRSSATRTTPAALHSLTLQLLLSCLILVDGSKQFLKSFVGPIIDWALAFEKWAQFATHGSGSSR